MTIEETKTETNVSFFDRPGVEKGLIDIGDGIPFGIESVTNLSVGIGGVYGTWGESYDNDRLPSFLEARLGHPLPPKEKLNATAEGVGESMKTGGWCSVGQCPAKGFKPIH